MFERIFSLEPDKTYEELKSILLRNRCKIIAEEQPKYISVKQGSLWGISPKDTKKVVNFHLSAQDSKTRIVSTASLSSDSIILSGFGFVFLGIIALLNWWIAVDLESVIMTQKISFWGGLLEFFDFMGYQEALIFVNNLKILTIVIVFVFIVLAIIDGYVYARKDAFAEEKLGLLP